MINNNFAIKVATREEINIAIEWAANEGWNPGHHDAACYYTTDPNGFLIGFLGNQPIATISAIKYGTSFGFLGFYIVAPAYRGMGYGLQIWNAGLKQLAGRNIGLDGVIAQQENYKKSGFKLAYRNIRYEGFFDDQTIDQSEIINLKNLPFKTINSYDQPFFPTNRSAFIKSWINQPQCTALGIIREGKLVGYGVIRKCLSGSKIGPLFANNAEVSELILLSLTARVSPKEPIYLDLPEVNQAAVSLAERYNMKTVFETARMYTDNQPDIPLHRIFGITSFEVG